MPLFTKHHPKPPLIKPLADWNLQDIFIIQGSWYIMDGIIFLLKQIAIPGLEQLTMFLHLLFLSAGRFLLVPLILFWVRIYYDIDNLNLGISINWRSVKQGLLAVLPYIFMVILFLAFPLGYQLLDSSLLSPVFKLATPEGLARGIFYLALICLPILPAAIAEEIFFRGFCYPFFERKLGPYLGGLVSSLYYSIALLDFNLLFIVHFLVGLMTTYLFQRTRSIIPGVIFQAIYHGALILFLFGWGFW